MHPPRNIAVALFGAIGDVLLSTPLLEALGESCPESRITYVVGSTAAPVLQGLPWVHRVIVVPDKEGQARRLNDARLLSEIWKGSFDWAFCLSRSVKLALAFWLSRVPVRLGFTPMPSPWMFTHRLDIGSFHSAHRTELFLSAAARLGLSKPERIRLHYRVTSEESDRALELLRSMGADPRKITLIAIHPGTSRVQEAKRRWDVGNFVSVAKHVLRTPGRRIVLLGGADEVRLGREFMRCVPGEAIDLTGRFSLREFAAVLQQCHLLVHNDSSPLHLAGALGVPVLAIFGYQNPILWGPLGARDRVVRLDLKCSPCVPDSPCEHSFACIRGLRPEAVIQTLDAMLLQPRPSRAR